MTRVRSLTATLLAALLASCGGTTGDGDRAPDDAAAPQPHLALSAASLAYSSTAGGRNPRPQFFMVSNSGAGAMGKPAATTSAPWLTPFVSGGGPDYKVLIEVDTAGLAAGDHVESVTLVTNADNSPVQVPVVIHLSPAELGAVGSVEIYSGGFLLTSPGELTRLWAAVRDGDGRLLDVLPTFRSLAPDVISVTPDGIAVAEVSVGSAQVVAEAGGVTSPPVVGVIASPVPGALVIDDGDLMAPPAGVDPGAPFGPGWRYQIRVLGNAIAMPGAIVVTRGRERVAGRVVATSLDPESTDFVLEVVPLAEVFSELEVSEAFPLGSPTEVASPTFTCTTGKPGSGGSATLRELSLPPPELGLDASARIGMATLELSGSLRGTVTVDVSLPAGFDDTITCEAPAGELGAGWPGALATVLPSRFPYGAGFALSAATGGDLTLTSVLRMDATARWGIHAGGGTTGLQGSFDLRPEVSLVPSTSGAAYRADVSPYLYVRLSGGPAWAPAGGGFDLVEARAGLSGGIDSAPPRQQAADPAYASSWALAAFARVAPGSGDAAVSGHLGLLGGQAPLELPAGLEVPLWRSPAGTLAADPAQVAPGGSVSLTLTLPDLVAPPGGTPVGRVELYRRVAGPAGALVLLCSVEPAASAQKVFSCTAGFPDTAPGDRVDVYAFAVDPTGALTTEVGPDGVASVTVE